MCASLYARGAGGDELCAALYAVEGGLSFGVSKFLLRQFSHYSPPPHAMWAVGGGSRRRHAAGMRRGSIGLQT